MLQRLRGPECFPSGVARHPEEEPVGSARRLASRRAGPWAPLAGSLRAGQAHGLRSQARFAQGTRRRIYPASRRTPEATDPSQAQDDIRARTAGKHLAAPFGAQLAYLFEGVRVVDILAPSSGALESDQVIQTDHLDVQFVGQVVNLNAACQVSVAPRACRGGENIEGASIGADGERGPVRDG